MALSGNLRDFNITNIIQLNCIENNTAQIVINWKGHEASIFILKGEIIHARFKDFKGEEALYRILRLDEGEFSITKPMIIPDRTINDSWKGLLLEGMRVMDESEKEKDIIVKTLALDLGNHPTVSKLLILTRSGDCIKNSGFESPERFFALAVALLGKTRELSAKLVLGDVIFTTYPSAEDNVYFFDCDGYYVIAVSHRESDIEPLFMLLDDVRSKLKITESQTREICPHS